MGEKKGRKKKTKGREEGIIYWILKVGHLMEKLFPFFFFITSSMVHIVGTHIEVRIIGINKPERFKQKFAK